MKRNPPMRSRLLESLFISTAITFVLTLMLYVLVSGRNPINRVRFALFISVLPAVLTVVIVKLCRLPEVWWCPTIVYLGLLVAVVLQQMLFRLAG